MLKMNLNAKSIIKNSTIYLDNFCQFCFNNLNYIIIKYDEIKIEDIKIEQLFNKINNKNKSFEESNINNKFIIIDKNNGDCEILSEEEEEMFNNLIKIIINDYKTYPNFSHFFNIKNLLYFFNIEDKQIPNEMRDSIANL